MTGEERGSIENGIWLCHNCAKLVDSDTVRYPVAVLVAMKDAAENRTRAAVGMPATEEVRVPRERLTGDIRHEVREILDGLREIREEIVRDGEVRIDAISRLHLLRENSAILLGEEMAAYIYEWIEHAAALNTGRGVLDNPMVPAEERQRWIEADTRALQFFSKQFAEVAKHFRPFLGVA